MRDLRLAVKITGDGKNLKASIKGAESDLKGLGSKSEAAAKKANKSFTNASKGVDSISSSLRNMRNVAVGAFAFAGLSNVTSTLVDASDAFTSVNARLKLATSSTLEFSIAQQGLSDIARETRGDWAGTVDLYSRMSMATQDLGIKQSVLLGVTKSINQAIVVSGASSVEAGAALTQLGQGLASGTLRGEELNSILEQTPRIARMIADGAGIAFGDLRKVASEGKLTADVVIKALENQSAVVAREFETMPATIAQSTLQVNNAFTQVWGNFTTTAGAAESLSDSILFLADNLKTILSGALLIGKIALVGYTAKLVMATAATRVATLSTLNLRAASLGLFMLYKTGGVSSLLSAPFISMTAATKKAFAGVSKLKLAGSVLFAAYAGWEIGSYLHKEFQTVRLAGLAMSKGLLDAWEYVKFGASATGEAISAAFTGSINSVKKYLGLTIELASEAMKALGMGGVNTDNMDAFAASLQAGKSGAEQFTEAMKTLRGELDKNLAINQKGFDIMADEELSPKQAVKNESTEVDPAVAAAAAARKAALAKGVAATQAAASKVIDIHSRKFADITAIGRMFDLSEVDRLLAKSDLDISNIEAERQRMESAAMTQGANAEDIHNIGLYYDGLKIERAERTAEAIEAIENDAFLKEEERDNNRLARKEASEAAAVAFTSASHAVRSDIADIFDSTRIISMDSMVANYSKMLKSFDKMDKDSSEYRSAVAKGSLDMLSGLMSSNTKETFEIGKAASLAQTAMSTYEGVMKAWSQGGIFGFAGAGIIAAAGIMNIKKIASTKMGAGAGVPTPARGSNPAYAAPASTTNASQVGNEGAANQPSTISVYNQNVAPQSEPSVFVNDIVSRLGVGSGTDALAKIMKSAAPYGTRLPEVKPLETFSNIGMKPNAAGYSAAPKPTDVIEKTNHVTNIYNTNSFEGSLMTPEYIAEVVAPSLHDLALSGDAIIVPPDSANGRLLAA